MDLHQILKEVTAQPDELYSTNVADEAMYKSYQNAAMESMKVGFEILCSADFASKKDWKFEAESSDKRDKVYGKKFPNGRMFVLCAEVDFTVDEVFEDFFTTVEDTVKWNPEVIEFKKVLNYSAFGSIVYMASSDILGGLIKSREYCDSRCFRKLSDGSYVISMKSVECKEAPNVKGRVRAVTLLSALRLSVHNDDPKKCAITWAVQSDIKGMLPKSLVDKVSHYWLLNHTKLLKEWMAIKRNGPKT